MTFEPELGQFAFSNTEWKREELDDSVRAGIELLADLVTKGEGYRFVSNYGAEPFDNGTFSLSAYCWCDGAAEGHEDGCPPNFKYGDFEVAWYKHIGRGASQSRELDWSEWWPIFVQCVRSVAA